MEKKSPLPCPSTVTVRRNPYRKARATPLTNPSLLPSQSTSSSKLPQISSFPIQDILSEEIHQNAPPIVTPASPSPSLDSIAENLKVYLRIRPLVLLKASKKNTEDPNPRTRPKNVWPKKSKKNRVKEKKSESYIKVNEDFHSVTLSPPLHLQATKRIKSEVYEGFSHVFSAESTQIEVYENMVNPLVEDFLKGKSRMLAALGPTGSGKTHTVFGSPREPGMVPLALQRIFKPAQGYRSQSSLCQFYLSIFEICAERGKTERICDLTSDGPDLSMQQSVIKGLQEVLVRDVAEAELLIARALMKRSTAMTNANSQSSRSQCIINIRRGTDRSVAENDEQSNSAVLSIVDLAGAEREKRTGNQGARLAESNFINNTSMVFGLCLRSLLEHQKNPKKALPKHFQNSLLTKYLRDYLEGKKSMALILTIKCGEEDYLDASYLLRQASPYMKIKFTNIEAQSDLLCNKRQFQTTTRAEQPKRMKLGNPDTSVIEGKIVGDENQLPDEEDPRSCNAEFNNIGPLNLNSDHLMKKERPHQIMQNFAKALWSVLKQHNEKLKVAESEILILRENLRNEKIRSTEMEKELQNLRSCCTCSKENSVASTMVKVGESFESMVLLKGDTCRADEKKLDLNSSNDIKSESSGSPRICDSTPGEDQIKLDLSSSNDFKSESSSSPRTCDSTPGEDQVLSLGNVKVDFPNCNCSPEKGNSFPRLQSDMCSQVLSHNIYSNSSGHECVDDKQEPEAMVRLAVNVDDKQVPEAMVRLAVKVDDRQEPEAMVRSSEADVSSPNCNCQSCQIHDEASSESNCAAVEHIDPNSDVTVSNSSDASNTSMLPGQQLGENNEDTVDLPVVPKDVEHTQQKELIVVPESETRPDISCNSLKKEKPKRRLLPASSILVREISTFDADEFDKPKGNGGGKNMAASERQRTQGSISLLRLLQSNLYSRV